MSKVNKAVDKALRIVLPAQESGYGNGKYD